MSDTISRWARPDLASRDANLRNGIASLPRLRMDPVGRLERGETGRSMERVACPIGLPQLAVSVISVGQLTTERGTLTQLRQFAASQSRRGR